jgi:hypothetical protein
MKAAPKEKKRIICQASLLVVVELFAIISFQGLLCPVCNSSLTCTVFCAFARVPTMVLSAFNLTRTVIVQNQ